MIKTERASQRDLHRSWLAQFGRISCNPLLRFLRGFQEGETLSAHSELDLQGKEREGFVLSSKGMVSAAQLSRSIVPHIVTQVVSPCKATRFTVVTSRGRLSKEVKQWLQRSNAQHQTISAKVVKRLGQTKTGESDQWHEGAKYVWHCLCFHQDRIEQTSDLKTITACGLNTPTQYHTTPDSSPWHYVLWLLDCWLVHFLKWPRSHRFCLDVAGHGSTHSHLHQSICSL